MNTTPVVIYLYDTAQSKARHQNLALN